MIWLLDSWLGQADGSISRQSERTSAGLLELDLAWAPTHTLTNPFTEVVDHSAAVSILAAGWWRATTQPSRLSRCCLAVAQVPQTQVTTVGRWRLVPGSQAGAVEDLSSTDGAQVERCTDEVPRIAPVGLQNTVERHLFPHWWHTLLRVCRFGSRRSRSVCSGFDVG